MTRKLFTVYKKSKIYKRTKQLFQKKEYCVFSSLTSYDCINRNKYCNLLTDFDLKLYILLIGIPIDILLLH